MAFRIKRLSYDALFVATALILSYVELLFPPIVPIPGWKLGLTNLIIMLCAKHISIWDAAAVSFLRVCCIALLFGNATSFWFSLFGATLAWGTMLIFLTPHSPFSLVGVSVLCAAMHQFGQILAAVILFQTTAFFFTYLPILLLISIVTGTVIGWLFLWTSRRFQLLAHLI